MFSDSDWDDSTIHLPLMKLFIEGNIAQFRNRCGCVPSLAEFVFAPANPRSWDRSIVVHDESSKTEVVHRRATNSHKARRSTIQIFLGSSEILG